MKLAGFAAIATLAFGMGMAQAQVTSTSNTSTNTTAQTNASNEGVSLANTFNTNTPADTKSTLKYEGAFGTNTAVGLGSFAGSFSQDYCGGTAQGGLSVPYATVAFGKPILGEAGISCVKLRTFERTMQASVSFGSAAATARGSNDSDTAKAMAAMSLKLAKTGVNILCSVSEDVAKAYVDAGIECPKATKVPAGMAFNEARERDEPTDNLVRARANLPLLPEVQ